MNRLLLACVLATSCLPAFAADPVPAESPTAAQTAAETAAIGAAERMGLTIFLHDRAAAVATDAVLALQAFRQDHRVRGWITEEHDGRITVTFIDQTPAALYRVEVSPEGEAGPVSALDSPAALTDFEAGAAAARAVALGAEFQRCSANYNSVVLPDPDAAAGARWRVYLLPGTTESDVVPVGGTYRVDVADGQIVFQRGFTRSCIALHTGAQVVGLMITHLLDPIPTEAHVFWGLWSGKRFYVSTAPNRALWVIEDGRIARVERDDAPQD